MSYYQEKQYLAAVDQNNTLVGTIEKWEVHRKGILHRGFSIALLYENKIILQHRKHPAFDGYFDFTCSSHPLCIGKTVQTNQDALYQGLLREWNIKKKGVDGLKCIGSIVYTAKDPKSNFIEHEYCSFYTAKISFLPAPNLAFAYGSLLCSLSALKNKKGKIYKTLAPWVKACVDKRLLQ